MTLRYVTTGAWGAGGGIELTKAQGDENIYTLALRIAALEAGIPVDGTLTLVQTGSSVEFFQDGVSIGSVTLPSTTWRAAGEWAASTVYFKNDIISVESAGIFLVLQDHTAVAPFDADRILASASVYLQLMEVTNPAGVVTVSGESLVLTSAHANKYIRCTNNTICNVYLEAGVFPDNTEIHFRQAGSGPIVVSHGDSGTQIIPPTGYDTASERLGATFTIKNAGSDVWDAFGDLALTT
jgi:hypothetical protein